MSSNFTNVPARKNGGIFNSSWVNTLRTAGIVVESMLTALIGGGGSVTEQSFAIANNQTSSSITGLIASTSYKRTTVKYWVKRKATATYIECGHFDIMYDGTNFFIGGPTKTGEANITFDIDSGTGQVSYTSDNQSGSYDSVNSKMGYTLSTMGS